MFRRLALLSLLSLSASAQTFTLDGGAVFTVVPRPTEKVEPFEKGNKPSFAVPSHASADLKPQGWLHVVDLAEWKNFFAASPGDLKACVTEPLKALQQSLKAKAAVPAAGMALACEDAHQDFLLFPRKVTFNGGTGWLYLTQWMIEAVLPSNRGIALHFEGVTSDGKTWVQLTLPVRVEGFPDDEGELMNDDKKLRPLIDARIKQLKDLGPSAVKPSIDEVEAVLKTMQISSRKP
ncbi:MAG: hypothetical protein QM817_15255 [Archangium sp.]